MPTKTPLSNRLRTHARIMRRTATPPEHRLWQALRNNQLNGCKFRRQTPIGPYIVDFYYAAAGLIVEVDGITHTDLPRMRSAQPGSNAKATGFCASGTTKS
jgi:very-short-patch-repair endonuclease